MMNKTKFKICKKNGFHTFADGTQNTADSVNENLKIMEVSFDCLICGAEAKGQVFWETLEDE